MFYVRPLPATAIPAVSDPDAIDLDDDDDGVCPTLVYIYDDA